MDVLKVLSIEDSESDVELLRYNLKKRGIEFVLNNVDTEERLIEELNNSKPDIIISDNTLPTLDAATAFDLVRQRYFDLPFIVFSGATEDRLMPMKDKGATACVANKDFNLLLELISQHIKNS